MEAIHDCQSALTSSVKVDLSILQHDMQKILSRVTAAGQKISDVEDVCRLMAVLLNNIWLIIPLN